jgi:hypothetical protein
MIEGPPLVYTKLKSPRHRDQTDVIELVKAGLNVERCREYLSTPAPSFVAEFDDAVRRARTEEEQPADTGLGALARRAGIGSALRCCTRLYRKPSTTYRVPRQAWYL